MRKVTIAVAVLGTLIAVPAFAADIPVKAPPHAAAPLPSWTGFYVGAEFGAGWNGDQTVIFSPNDPAAASLITGFGLPLEQPLANSQEISQSGWVGGFEGGYNWQAASNWLVGLEADLSRSSISGEASGPTSNLIGGGTPVTQFTDAKQSTNWYGTVRGRAGFLATPNLLLFGTGGFAYGKVVDSASYLTNSASTTITQFSGGFAFTCSHFNPTCFAGSSSAIKTGFTAGGGAELLLDQHWSAKIDYQFVDLGTETVRVTALIGFLGNALSSFNAAFRDQFHVVRVGLNYRF